MNTRTFLPAVTIALMLNMGCQTAQTSIMFANAYAAPGHSGDSPVAVYELSWKTTLFDDPILAGDESSPKRTVAGSDYAYAVLATSSHGSGTAWHGFVPIRSKHKLTAPQGGVLRIGVSDLTFEGRCDGGEPLSQHDADFITQHIFAKTFANIRYDAATCSSTRVAADAGIEDDGGGQGH